MNILIYNELNTKNITGFSKLSQYLANDDFRSADVKKIGDNLYRARLNRSDRILFAIYCYQGKHYALILEYIKNHAYEQSRFLHRDVVIDEDKIPTLEQLPATIDANLPYINPQNSHFSWLGKFISFDPHQQSIYAQPSPLIIIGSAGSGKTALLLEKMKLAKGDVLYVSLSPYLVKNARDLYYAQHYENEHQNVSFLSFAEFLESIHIPAGQAITFALFQQWFTRQPRRDSLKDAHKLFEEFRGVLTGSTVEKPYLSQEDYLGLGIKQSIFNADERPLVYEFFSRYRAFLHDNRYYDSNMVSHDYLSKIDVLYDCIVIDEVQDFTNIQLFLILKSLHHSANFLLCGDSNQIVHPNFFSWSKLKSLFYQHEELQGQQEIVRILHTNYRNSPQVTELANRILRLKNARFGSVDRESHYLIESNGHVQGDVVLLQDKMNILQELNNKTRASTQFAVVVMHNEQKAEASRHFSTPLVFSIQEAKGLEYENLILYNFVSAEDKRFRDISEGVSHEDLQQELKYGRVKDKSDKSLEVYKFYINALYVALTRAICNVYWIEENNQHRLLQLLGLDSAQDSLSLAAQKSSLQDWQREAHKLELQGKQEQADRIRQEILQQQTPDWPVYTGEVLSQLAHQALEAKDKKAKLMLFEYAMVYNDQEYLYKLIRSDFKPAIHPENGLKLLLQKYYLPYQSKSLTTLRGQVVKYGVDFRNSFNQTPLMVAAWLGNAELMHELLTNTANTDKVNNNGCNAFQIALEQASHSSKYAKTTLATLYEQLEPDSLSVQIDGRLVKLDNHLMEFFIFNLLIALFYRELPKTLLHGGFNANSILDAIEHFPISILPERRKQRAYVSSILSKNEMKGGDRYNRKLFYRVKTGYYLFNPNLSIKAEGEWRPIYQLLGLDKLRYNRDRAIGHSVWFEEYAENIWQGIKERLTAATIQSPQSE